MKRYEITVLSASSDGKASIWVYRQISKGPGGMIFPAGLKNPAGQEAAAGQ